MVGEEEELFIPPPAFDELVTKVVLVIAGVEKELLKMPPPLLLDELPIKMQLVILGEEPWL